MSDEGNGPDRVRGIFAGVLAQGRKHLTELESKDVLISRGIPVVPTRLATSPDEATTMAAGMGFPVVLKISSPHIVHKSDAGGVRAGIRDRSGVDSAFREIMENARLYDRDARLDGVVVQAMEQRGLELIVGGIRDPVFGPTVMFGLGGTWVEVFRDVKFSLAPLNRTKAEELMDTIRGAAILRGFRGGRPVDREVLADIIVSVGRLMADHPYIGEIDINPVIARLDGAVAVDARIVLVKGTSARDLEGPVGGAGGADAAGATAAARRIGGGPTRERILSLFDPTFALVVGSSSIVEDAGMTSPLLFSNIQKNIRELFSGGSAVVDVDRAGEVSVGGASAASARELLDGTSLERIRSGRSCAVMVLPPEESIAWAGPLMELGVKAIIQITGGFSDAQRARYLEEARRNGTRVLGPNTIMGVINTETGFNTSFEEGVHPPAGNISVVSQSGGVGATLLDFACHFGIGIDQFVFMGDKMDADDINVLEHLGARERTKVVAVYMEGVRDGRRFVRTARELTARKPVVVLKGGRSQAAARRALSHTASIAGSEQVFDAAFREAGVIRASGIEELFGLSLALSEQPPMRGRRVAVVSNVGGPAILAADALTDVGLAMAQLTPETVESLAEMYPKVETINPIDLIADARADRFAAVLDAVLADPGVDGVMLISMLKSCLMQPEDASVFPEVVGAHGKPVVVVPGGGDDFTTVYEVLKGTGLPCYNMVEKAAAALRGLYLYGMRRGA